MRPLIAFEVQDSRVAVAAAVRDRSAAPEAPACSRAAERSRRASSARTRRARTATLRAMLFSLVALVATGCPHQDPPQPSKPVQPTPAAPAPLPGSGPRAEIEFPPEHGFVRTQILRVRGRAADVQELYLNSDHVACRADGSFDVKLEVPGGQGEIVVRDGARPDAPLLVRHVTVDLDAPMIELTELPGEAVENQRYRRRVNTPHVTLRGRATDAKPGEVATVTLDGKDCALAADGVFEVEVEIPATGERRYELEVVDRAWNRARLVLTLVR